MGLFHGHGHHARPLFQLQWHSQLLDPVKNRTVYILSALLVLFGAAACELGGRVTPDLSGVGHCVMFPELIIDIAITRNAHGDTIVAALMALVLSWGFYVGLFLCARAAIRKVRARKGTNTFT